MTRTEIILCVLKRINFRIKNVDDDPQVQLTNFIFAKIFYFSEPFCIGHEYCKKTIFMDPLLFHPVQMLIR